jgi:uncharacterized membrane protein
VDQDRQSRWLATIRHVHQDRQSRWLATIRYVLWTVGIVVALAGVIIIVLGYVREWEWTGLVKDKAYTKRTLWDWLQLLIIPAVLAGVGLWFNRQQREQELHTADRRAQDEALQAYLDQISDMLSPKNHQPSLSDEEPPDSLRAVARARTLTVLTRLGGERKGSVLQFLHELDLINKHHVVVELVEADLSGAALNLADLSRANLKGTLLIGANLIGANLSRANLTEAILHQAKGWTEEQLSEASSLDGATMPDLRVLKGPENPNGPTFTEWLKSNCRGEAGENRGP